MKVRLRLSEPWIEMLCRLPETGMGYQRVNVELQDGLVVNDVLVFNAEEMELPAGNDAIRSKDIVRITLSGQSGS